MLQGVEVLNDRLDFKLDVRQDKAPHQEHRITMQIAAGLIVFGVVGGGATSVVLGMRSHNVAVTQQRPSLAGQLALTAGYRAVLYNQTMRGN